MLDQITLAGAVVACVAYEPADAVELLVAREDEEVLPGSAPAVVLPLNLVDELADQVEDAVSRPDPIPEVVGRIAGAGGRNRRVPRAAEAALVERQEPGLRAGELGGHEHLVRIHGEVGEAAPVGEEWLARIPVVSVLPDGVFDVLAGERVLEFRRKDGDAVQEEPEIDALVALLAEVELAHHREEVGRVQSLELLVETACGPEVSEPEFAPRVLDAVPQHVERTPAGDLAREPAEEARLHVGAVVLFQLGPLLWLSGQEEVDDVGRDQAESAFVVRRAALVEAAG